MHKKTFTFSSNLYNAEKHNAGKDGINLQIKSCCAHSYAFGSTAARGWVSQNLHIWSRQKAAGGWTEQSCTSSYLDHSDLYLFRGGFRCLCILPCHRAQARSAVKKLGSSPLRLFLQFCPCGSCQCFCIPSPDPTAGGVLNWKHWNWDPKFLMLLFQVVNCLQ